MSSFYGDGGPRYVAPDAPTWRVGPPNAPGVTIRGTEREAYQLAQSMGAGPVWLMAADGRSWHTAGAEPGGARWRAGRMVAVRLDGAQLPGDA